MALWKTNSLSDEEKKKLAVCLKMELISSEESDGSDKEDEERASPSILFLGEVRRLPHCLDRKFSKILTRRSVQMTQSRKTGLPSDHPKPDSNGLDLPEWALMV